MPTGVARHRGARGRSDSLDGDLGETMRSTRRGGSGGDGGDEARMPGCAICGHRGRGDRAQHHLTHGVVVWLCAAHRAEGFLHRRAGHEFAKRLASAWEATGALTRRRSATLLTHIRQVREAVSPKTLPGSYAWPNLRKDAERRFAAGEAPDVVIDELRSTYRDGPAMVPSVRTMRRWFTQGRWRVSSGSTRRPARRTAKPRSPYRDPFLDYLVTGNVNPLWALVRRMPAGP